jgi:hypothetical protein
MPKQIAKVDIAVFNGPESISIVFFRENKKNGVREYKSPGMHPWHPMGEIDLKNIGPEKPLMENGIKTSKRCVIINQNLKGDVCGLQANPKLLADFEAMKATLIYKSRLCKFYYDRLINMMGEDSFTAMMKKTFKAVGDAKQAGNVYDSMGGGFGGSFGRHGMMKSYSNNSGDSKG